MDSSPLFSVLASNYRIGTTVPTTPLQVEAIHLLDDRRGRAFVKEVGKALQSPNAVVSASIFLKRYLALVTGALYSMTFHNHGLNIGLENLVLTAEDSWKTVSFSLKTPEGLGYHTGERSEWREKIVRHISNDNLQPLITALSAQTGVSPNLLWSHAAYSIHHYYRTWMKEAETDALLQRIEEDFLYLKEIEDPQMFGSCEKNPIGTTFIEVAHPAKPGELVRLRNNCCLAHSLPKGKCCYTCPKLDEEERIAQILALGK